MGALSKSVMCWSDWCWLLPDADGALLGPVSHPLFSSLCRLQVGSFDGFLRVYGADGKAALKTHRAGGPVTTCAISGPSAG